jgi:hypothetical protein
MQDIYEDPLVELTQSAISTYWSCPQKYVFRYLMHIRPKGVHLPFAVGSALHEGIRVFLSLKDTDLQQAANLARQQAQTVLERAENEDLGLGGTQTDKLQQARAQVDALLQCWFQAKASELNDWEILNTEYVVRAAPGATPESPLIDRMAGAIDGIIRVISEDTIKGLEIKSRASIKGDWVITLDLDLQLLWYTRMAMKMGFALQEFMYALLQKPQHRMRNDWEELAERMREAVSMDPDKYFALEPIPIDESRLLHLESSFARTVSTLDNLQPDQVFMKTSACFDYFSVCPFYHLCHAGADAANPEQVMNMPQIELYTTHTPHEELDEIEQLTEERNTLKKGGF